jgi:hypothetical protein
MHLKDAPRGGGAVSSTEGKAPALTQGRHRGIVACNTHGSVIGIAPSRSFGRLKMQIASKL